jgi:phosphomethylpyrimidine synthase
MTQIESAKRGIITEEMRRISEAEGVSLKFLQKNLAEGKVVIPKNNLHKVRKICGIGFGLRTKVNVNIGLSPDRQQLKDELKKLEVAIQYGADTVMDLSVGGDVRKIRSLILKKSTIPVGTVPIYQAAVEAKERYGSFLKMKEEDIFDVLESQAKEGVDFFTIHAGVTQQALKVLERVKRVLDIVSRGGAILACWMRYNNKENPFYKHFDKVLDIAYKYDITLSLGDGLRPGAIADSTDKVQIQELRTLGRLAERARERNIQVMIEGPGHVPIDQIEENVRLEKEICKDAPFYVLGPLVTDIAIGYDHIASAIGGALAGSFGADFLCYVTPSEHLRHPSISDVKEGLIASRIAAHAADIAKGINRAKDWDRQISLARKKRDWRRQRELSIDKEKMCIYRRESFSKSSDVCTMCGEYCALKLMEKKI